MPHSLAHHNGASAADRGKLQQHCMEWPTFPSSSGRPARIIGAIQYLSHAHALDVIRIYRIQLGSSFTENTDIREPSALASAV
eukprot:4672645-Pyramimonas_sp.AAC.1